MYIEDLRKEFYNVICSKKVLILANSDVDSICASKILQHLLHSDCTTYSLVPVYGHSSLEKAFAEHGTSYKHIVFLNCGGTIDLVETLQPDEDVEMFVADSHLPTDVNNIYNTGQIKLLLKPRAGDNIPDFDDIFQPDSEEEQEEDEGNESGEDIFADEEERPRKKSRFDETAILRRRERRLWEDKRNKILDEYTQSTYYGESVAFLMFELAWKLSKDSNELLWWAIIGVTEQSLLQKVDTAQFTLTVGRLQNHVSRLSKHGERANSVAKNCMKIFFEKDLSLVLYRHWTLTDSIYHTRYTACKFRIWTLKGQKRFAEFLADLGLPLSQCKQKYSAMCAEIRNELRSAFDSKKAKYDLSDIIDGTFHTNYGWKSRFCAMDVLYACLAQLESPDKRKSDMDRFHDAMDCLSRSKTDLLENGIDKAKSLLTSIYRLVHTLLDMSQVFVAGPFLYAVLTEGSPDSPYFSRPHSLTMLAQFLLSAFVATSRSKKATSLPLVLSAPYQSEEETCLVVGIPPVGQESPKNKHKKMFVEATNCAFLLVQHLCIADLFGAVFILPVPLLTTLRANWDAPNELCRFSSAVNVALWLQHIFMFVMLKVDRVLASFLPIGRYPVVSVPAVTIIIGGAWLTSASIASAVSSGVGSKFEPSVLLCVPKLPREFGITICTLYCSAFATMVVGYVIVILMLKRNENQREQDIEFRNQDGGVIVIRASGGGSPGRGLIRSTLASMFVTAAHLLLYVPTLLVLGLPGAIEHPVPVFLCALVVYSEFLVHPLVLLCSSTKLRNEVRKSLIGGIKKKLLHF